MFPLIPLIVAAGSAGVLAYRKYKNYPHAAREKRFLHYLKKLGVHVDKNGNFDPNEKCKGEPALFRVLCNEVNLISFLERGANPNICDSEGTPAIIFAAKRRNAEEIVRILLRYGADPNAMDSEGRTAIFYANSRAVLECLKNAGAELNAVDASGKPALFYAIPSGMARDLVVLGADVNVRDSEGKTAAFFITDRERFKLLEFLVDKGLDLDAVDVHGDRFGLYDIFKKWLLGSVDWNEALDRAVGDNDIEGARLALARGADPNIKHWRVKSWNMIHLAIHHNNPEMIRVLAEGGTDLNWSGDGIHPLEKAVINKNDECFEVLLKLGVDPAPAEDTVKYNGTSWMKAVYERYRSKLS